MRTTAMSTVLCGLLILGLGACSDYPSPVSPDWPAGPAAASRQTTTAKCDLLGDISTGIQEYFPWHARHAARALAWDLAKACGARNQAKVTKRATMLLAMMEAVLDAGRGRSPTVGSQLAGGLLACTVSLCRSYAVPGVDFSAALSENGLFAMRFGKDTRPAVARDALPFTDPGGSANAALWGVEVGLPWTKIMDANPVLVYGAPIAENGPSVTEAVFGAPAFEIDRWPGSGDVAIEDALHVGVCFATAFHVPHADDDPSTRSLLERIQREATLLSDYDPTFCSNPPSLASSSSVLGAAGRAVRALARTFLPQPLFASAREDRSVGRVGGSAQGFSPFTALGANTAGTLALLSEPDAVVVAGQDIGVILVQARSGGGTLMEKVEVTLAVHRNRGAPAGAFLTGDTEAFTSEQDGVATFEHVQVNKPGGYIVCATGELEGFTFEPVCTARFHAKKHRRERKRGPWWW